MTKLKSESSAKKKIRITKNKKIIFVHQMGRHLRAHKSASQKRRLKEPATLDKSLARSIIKSLPYN